jgi:HK97 family phage major capsid protein
VTIDQLLRSLADRKAGLKRRETDATVAARGILARARADGRSHLTGQEQARADGLLAERSTARAELAEVDRQIAECDRARDQEREETRMMNEIRPAYPAARAMPGAVLPGREGAAFRIGHERRTYEPDTDPKGAGFLMDVLRRQAYNDPSASERIGRHVHECEVDNPAYAKRASGTGNFAGLIVPQYLTNMYAPLARAMSPFADICNRHDLPNEGMTVNIPLLTTGDTVALQTSENNAPAGSSPNDTLLTENIQTATGNATISRQAIDRGTGVDEVVMQDLFRACWTTLDSTMINQTVTGLSALAGTAAGAYTGTAAAATLYSKILGAANGVEQAMLGLALPSHVIMSPSRWYWLAAQTGSIYPLINTFAPGAYPWSMGQMDQGAGYDTPAGNPVIGHIPAGLSVVIDANVPTNLGASANQDEVYVVPADECHLWIDPAAPVYIRAEQPQAASLGVLMVIYCYFAFSLRRYTGAMQKVAGTALVGPPSF